MIQTQSVNPVLDIFNVGLYRRVLLRLFGDLLAGCARPYRPSEHNAADRATYGNKRQYRL
jgi:hypothetical protein